MTGYVAEWPGSSRSGTGSWMRFECVLGVALGCCAFEQKGESAHPHSWRSQPVYHWEDSVVSCSFGDVAPGHFSAFKVAGFHKQLLEFCKLCAMVKTTVIF